MAFAMMSNLPTDYNNNKSVCNKNIKKKKRRYIMKDGEGKLSMTEDTEFGILTVYANSEKRLIPKMKKLKCLNNEIKIYNNRLD